MTLTLSSHVNGVHSVRGSRLPSGLLLATSLTLLAPLTGCESITGSARVAQVRILDATPDAPALDVYQGSGALAYNLGLGTITSYVPIMPGTYSTIVKTAGTGQQIAAAPGTFDDGGQYTVILGNSAISPQQLILKDQTHPAPPGEVALRFVHQATRTAAVDLYLVPSGSAVASVRPVLVNLSFGINAIYNNVPAATYTLVVLPAGATPSPSAPTLYTSPAAIYSSGSAKTVVLIDPPPHSARGVQAVVASDFDTNGPVN